MDSDTPDYGPNEILHAYHLAAQAGDHEAMNDLHGRLLNAYKAQDVNPTDEMSGMQQFAAGMGHGAQRLGEGLGNMVGLGHVFPKTFGDQALKDEDETAAPLLATGAGKAGDIAGQVAATAPLGMGSGTLMKALGPLAARGGAYTPALLRAALAGSEGALQGGAMADPEHQGEGAATGALLGSGLSAAGSAVGRGVRGLVGKSPAAQRLYQDADEEGKDLFIPISQGGEGAAKTIYKTALPYALGVEGQLKKQSQQAKNVVSEIAAERGMPAQADASGNLIKTPAPIGNTMEETAEGMRGAYDKVRDNTIHSRSFNAPEDFGSRVTANLRNSGIPEAHQKAISEHLENILDEFKDSDGTISGVNLLRAKQAAQETLPGLRSPAGAKVADKAAAGKAVKSFDDIIDDEIKENKSMTGKIDTSELEAMVSKSPKRGSKTSNNASGESSASQEAVNRVAQEKAAGQDRFMIDPDGKATPLNGVDAVDAKAPKGHIIVQRGVGAEEHTILDRGGLPAAQAKGLLNRAKALGELKSGKQTEDQKAASEAVNDLENYKRLGDTEPEGMAVAKTAEGNIPNRGELKFGKLAENSPPKTGMRSLAQDAHEVLEKESPGGVNPAGRHFIHAGGLLTGVLHPGLAPGIVGGNLLGNALATKTAQKGLYGDLAVQQAIAKAIRNNPKAAYSAGLAGRSAVNASGQ